MELDTRNEVIVKVRSIGPFLVTKGMALWERMNEKDAYDIHYCCRNYPGGLTALVEAARPLVGNRLLRGNASLLVSPSSWAAMGVRA